MKQVLKVKDLKTINSVIDLTITGLKSQDAKTNKLKSLAAVVDVLFIDGPEKDIVINGILDWAGIGNEKELISHVEK